MDEVKTGEWEMLERNVLNTETKKLLSATRPLLDDNSATARAIDSHAGWQSIALSAREEGFVEFAMYLELAAGMINGERSESIFDTILSNH